VDKSADFMNYRSGAAFIYIFIIQC